MKIASGPRRVGRPPGPAPDPARRREELLDAAVRAIRRIGPQASMDELAAEAGMTKPILYAHFRDKAGLATALADRYLGEVMPAVLASFVGEREPQDMVRSAIDTFIGFVERDPHVYRFLVRGVGGANRSFVEQPIVGEFALRIAEVLANGLRTAGGDPSPAELWSFAILGGVLTSAEWWQAKPAMSRGEVVEHLTAFIWGGLGAGGIDRLETGVALGPGAGDESVRELGR